MRLRFWNRLAIVAAALALIVVPAWIWTSAQYDTAEANEAAFNHCIASADRLAMSNQAEVRATALSANKTCWDNWEHVISHGGPGWPEYWSTVLAVGVAVAIAYVLLWLGALVTRWVLRGRLPPA